MLQMTGLEPFIPFVSVNNTLRPEPYLIALDVPDFNDSLLHLLEVKLVPLVEDGATVGAGVLGQVKARGVRLREEVPVVAQGGQGLLEEGEVVDLLETDNVRVVPGHLLQHAEPTCAPMEGTGWAADEVVILGSEGWKMKKKILVHDNVVFQMQSELHRKIKLANTKESISHDDLKRSVKS